MGQHADDVEAEQVLVEPRGSAGVPRWRRWVPIRSLSPRHRERILAHLLALDPRDRYLRFGYVATDGQIHRYVESLDFDRDEVFGIFNRHLHLIAIAHLALGTGLSGGDMAEFGVSVLPHTRGRGYGSRLFDRAVLHARNRGCNRLMIHALSENLAMLNIAIRAGATVGHDGGESEAWLSLPGQDAESRVDEFVEEKAAEWNYRVKVQARRLRRWIGDVRKVGIHFKPKGPPPK